MPYKDPKQAREYQRQRQRGRRAAGLCLNCAAAAAGGETRCDPCKQRRRPLERADKRLRRAGLPVGGPTTAPQPSPRRRWSDETGPGGGRTPPGPKRTVVATESPKPQA